jgi:hypothetical protein
MAKTSPKPTMMRFEPKAGWTEAATAEVVSIADHARKEVRVEPRVEHAEVQQFSSEALLNLGESIQDVFDSLQINDPRLQAWSQVHTAIKLIGTKLQEKKALEERISALIQEVESVRNLASELVSSAYRSEQEVHETSRLRMQIAESLSDKLVAALKA